MVPPARSPYLQDVSKPASSQYPPPAPSEASRSVRGTPEVLNHPVSR